MMAGTQHNPPRPSWRLHAFVLVLTAGALHPAAAQLGTPTPEEAKIGRPSPFAGPVGTQPPSTDPRDFSGMWRSPPMARPGGGGPGRPPGSGPGGPGGGGPGANRATSRYCIPSTMILTGVEAGTAILQTPTELRLVAEEQHNNRRIYIGQKHSVPLVRSTNGDSIAHWDGATLVIDTIGFIGYGVSPTLARTERLSKSPDGGTLIDNVSYSDPSGRTTPPAITAKAVWWPGTQVLEYICEDGADQYMREDYK